MSQTPIAPTVAHSNTLAHHIKFLFPPTDFSRSLSVKISESKEFTKVCLVGQAMLVTVALVSKAVTAVCTLCPLLSLLDPTHLWLAFVLDEVGGPLK